VQLPVTVVIDRRRLVARLLVRRDVETLTLHADGRCEIERPNGRLDDAAIDPVISTVFPWLVVLHYRVSGRRESLVLPVAAIGNAAHRRLRVWLRWGTIGPANRHETA
jgi:hypothetical protein